MAQPTVNGQGTFPNLAAPLDGVAGKTVMAFNLRRGLDVKGTGAGAKQYRVDLLKQANAWTATIV